MKRNGNYLEMSLTKCNRKGILFKYTMEKDILQGYQCDDD